MSGERILLAHGGGGRRMRDLVEREFLEAFGGPSPEALHDGFVIEPGPGRLAFTTDSFVVRPLFFPGGDIGKLAVCGTVNDLACCGARPRWLSAGFVLEEGLALEDLRRAVRSMAEAGRRAGVEIVTGDTKVVERGRGDGIYLNTAGIGLVEHDLEVAPASVRPGDAVLLSGDVGRHGIAVTSVREGLAFETGVESDCAPIHEPVLALIREGVRVRCVRDLTRGGLQAALVEIAESAGVEVRFEEASVPVCEAVAGACELLGLDPLAVANEGRFVAFVPGGDADRAREILRGFPAASEAAVIGGVGEGPRGRVLARTVVGSERVLTLPSTDPLPRIC
jgi:hydrogenase expression/formation protein HypE